MWLSPARHRIIGGILAGLPNVAAMAGMCLYYAGKGAIPKSLDVVGPFAPVFTVLLIVSTVVAGVLAMPRFPRFLYAEAAVRPLSAACLLSYAVAVATPPSTAWITVGFAIALGVEQLRRWHVLVTVSIPEARTLEVLALQQKQQG